MRQSRPVISLWLNEVELATTCHLFVIDQEKLQMCFKFSSNRNSHQLQPGCHRFETEILNSLKKKNSDIISNHVFIQEYNKNKVATRWFESLFTKRHISGELCLLVELESDWTVCVICQSSFTCTIMSENDCNQSERDWDCLETGCLLSLRSSRDRKWSPTVRPLMARRSTSHFYSSVTDLSGHQKRTIRPILLFIHVSLILNGQWL